MPTPSDVVNGILDDLMHVVKGVSADSGLDKLAAAFPRWKERSVRLLNDHVSAGEAARFASLRSKPSYVGMESWNEILDSHMLLLTTLLADIQRHPHDFEPKAAASPSPRARGLPSAVSELPRPSHVTIRWLIDHVPARYAVAFVGLLLGTFALGLKLGQVTEVIRIVGPILGIEAPKAP